MKSRWLWDLINIISSKGDLGFIKHIKLTIVKQEFFNSLVGHEYVPEAEQGLKLRLIQCDLLFLICD